MRLKELRKQRGFSQKEVADALDCSVTVYSRYETGAREPSIDMIIRLADFYGVSLDELVGRVPMEVTAIHGEAPPPESGRVQIVFEPDETPTPDELEARILSALQNQLPDLVRQEIQNQQKKG